MSRFTPAQRRYNRSVLLLCAAYALILFGVISFFKNSSPTGVSAYAAAILPALPIIGVFVAMGRYLADTIPGATAHFVAGAGHFLGLSHWGEILASLRQKAEAAAG